MSALFFSDFERVDEYVDYMHYLNRSVMNIKPLQRFTTTLHSNYQIQKGQQLPANVAIQT